MDAVGVNARPGGVPDELLEFVKQQAPGARYILSVCTGSWILAGTGLLDGKRATTNKSYFNRVKVCLMLGSSYRDNSHTRKQQRTRILHGFLKHAG